MEFYGISKFAIIEPKTGMNSSIYSTDYQLIMGTKKRRYLAITSLRAQDETRTHTTLQSLPPQSSVYTNFTTCASSKHARTHTEFFAFATDSIKPSRFLLLTKQRGIIWSLLQSFKTTDLTVPETGLEPARG